VIDVSNERLARKVCQHSTAELKDSRAVCSDERFDIVGVVAFRHHRTDGRHSTGNARPCRPQPAGGNSDALWQNCQVAGGRYGSRSRASYRVKRAPSWINGVWRPISAHATFANLNSQTHVISCPTEGAE
jgi:hypothetical protein